MGLRLTASGSDRINHGSGSRLDDITTGTILVWLYIDGYGGEYRWVLDKSNTNFTQYWYLAMSNTGAPAFEIDFSTTDLTIESTTALGTGAWKFIAVSFDQGGANGDQQMWIGDLTGNLSEVSYSTQRIGVGAIISSAAHSLLVGNRAQLDRALDGVVGFVGIWDTAFSLAEIAAQQFHLDSPLYPTNCVLFCHYGFNGTGTQADWSGNLNNGTQTGCTKDQHVPVPILQTRSGFQDAQAVDVPVDFDLDSQESLVLTAQSGALASNTFATQENLTPAGQAASLAANTFNIQDNFVPAGQAASFGAFSAGVNQDLLLSAISASLADFSLDATGDMTFGALATTLASLAPGVNVSITFQGVQSFLVNFSLGASVGMTPAAQAASSAQFTLATQENLTPAAIAASLANVSLGATGDMTFGALAATLASLAPGVNVSITFDGVQTFFVDFSLGATSGYTPSAQAASLGDLPLSTQGNLTVTAQAASLAQLAFDTNQATAVLAQAASLGSVSFGSLVGATVSALANRIVGFSLDSVESVTLSSQASGQATLTLSLSNNATVDARAVAYAAQGLSITASAAFSGVDVILSIKTPFERIYFVPKENRLTFIDLEERTVFVKK